MKICLFCSFTNPIFGKIFVPKICAKMFSANQIGGLFDQPFIFPEQISEVAWVFYMLMRVHIDQKLMKKILGGHGQK